MKTNLEAKPDQDNKRQRGAALITVLMISTLLLATGGTLVLVTSLSARSTIDATAEMQAYYSAEAGMQDTLNVLRGNVAPQPSMPAGSKISFRGAVTAATSNRPGDSSTAFRLSGWLNYNYSYSGGGSPDRVALTANYSPLNGLAYSVEVSDPDNTPPANGEPKRLLVRVRGYGPKGAEKRLELIVKRSKFDYSPQCVICVRSSDDGTPVNFTIGNSAAKEYQGADRAGGGTLPAFGSTSAGDTAIQIGEASKETVSNPIATTMNMASLPPWVQDVVKAREFLVDQKANAIEQRRYFTSFSGMSGSETDPKFTFVDGDCELDGGAGLLIVTGKLLMKGNPSFKGLILVLGEGYVERDGGGNGNIYGAMFVSRFNRNGGPFLAPTFMTNGGGNSTVQNDSAAWGQAQNLSGPLVQGVHEY
ncbi:MAG TPA: pilus assembly PilX N-terminal domain-containing protein [Pyrinomonadaceae bacterium]|nr:pilus assembly PilX N-terminal domain-containing protein [Pyrinomonadaceae bacterium]